LLGVARRDLDALHAEPRLTVRRRDDASIERELLLLRLELRLELRQRELDLRVRFPVDLARRLEHRELALQLVDGLRLLGGLPAQTLDLRAMVEQRIAGLIPAELEHEVGGAENEHASEPDQPGTRALHVSRTTGIIARVLSQPAPGRTRTRLTRGRSAQAAGLRPAARPPRRRSGRTAVRKGQRPKLGQRTDVNEPLEIDDLLDRPPVVDPAAAIEFRLVGHVEAQAVGLAVQMQQKPALLLPDAYRGLLAADVALRETIAEPAPRLADELDVAGPEADLLVQLPVHRGFRALVRPDPALRELPAAPPAPAGDQHAPVAVHQDDADVRAVTLFVDEVHGFGRRPRGPPNPPDALNRT